MTGDREDSLGPLLVYCTVLIKQDKLNNKAIKNNPNNLGNEGNKSINKNNPYS